MKMRAPGTCCTCKLGTHGDANTAACCEASATIKAAIHHHCGARRVHGSHGIVRHGYILTHRANRHVRLHGHVHLGPRVGRGHLRQLARHLRWKHISGLVYLQTDTHISSLFAVRTVSNRMSYTRMQQSPQNMQGVCLCKEVPEETFA